MSLNEIILLQVIALAKASLPNGAPIIRGRSNAPPPEGRYLVVMPIVTLGGHGQAASVFDGDEHLDKFFNWTGEVDIREVNGDGDWLRLWLEGTEREDVKTHMPSVSFMGSTEVQDLSTQVGTKWVSESRIGVRIHVRTTRRDLVGYFDKIGLTGTVEGSFDEITVTI